MSEQRVSEERSMVPTIIKIARNPERPNAPESYPGWIVPDTDGLMAIDQRLAAVPEMLEPAWWTVTHIPTGMRVTKPGFTDAYTQEQAADVARRFYNAYRIRGWPIESADASRIISVHNDLSDDEKRRFWREVAGIDP